MDQATATLQKLIDNAKSSSECDELQQKLQELLKCVGTKKDRLDDKEREVELKYTGRDSVQCSFCSNTVRSQGEFVGKCEGCDSVGCVDCFSFCKECEEPFCHENCLTSCEYCEEYFCPGCSKAKMDGCWKCGENVCSDCTTPVGPPGWPCCKACVDEWVEDGWREY